MYFSNYTTKYATLVVPLRGGEQALFFLDMLVYARSGRLGVVVYLRDNQILETTVSMEAFKKLLSEEKPE